MSPPKRIYLPPIFERFVGRSWAWRLVRGSENIEELRADVRESPDDDVARTEFINEENRQIND